MEKLVGYHGTFEEFVEDILSRGFFIAEKDDHYLGNGIYFFKDDYEEARTWSFIQKKNRNNYANKRVAVIKALILVHKDYLLDLTNRKGIKIFTDQANNFLNDKNNKIKFNKKHKNRNRSFLIDYLCKEYEYKVVMCAFPDRMKALYEIDEEYCVNVGFYPIHICVREESLIKKKKCVYIEQYKQYKETSLIFRYEKIRGVYGGQISK